MKEPKAGDVTAVLCRMVADCLDALQREAVRREQLEKFVQALILALTEYNAAIVACANEPEKMASACTAQGQSLDELYDRWLDLASNPPGPNPFPKPEGKPDA